MAYFSILLIFIFSSCSSSSDSDKPNSKNNCLSDSDKPNSKNTISSLSFRHWPTSSLPLPLVYSEDFNSNFRGYSDDGNNPLEQVLAEWDDAVTANLFDLPLGTSVPNKEETKLSDYLDDIFGIYKHYTWVPSILGLDKALAITQTFTELCSNVIVESDIIFNYKHFPDITLDKGDASNHDLHSIMLHEVGHLLGFGHENEEPSVMAESLGPADVKRTLEPFDIETVRNRYGGTSRPTIRSGEEMILELEEEEETGYPDSYEYEKDGLVRTIFALFPDGKCRKYIEDEDGLYHSSDFD